MCQLLTWHRSHFPEVKTKATEQARHYLTALLSMLVATPPPSTATASTPSAAAASEPRRNKFTPKKLDAKLEKRNVGFGKYKDQLPSVAIADLPYVLWILQRVCNESQPLFQSLGSYFLETYYQDQGKLYLAFDPKKPGLPAASTGLTSAGAEGSDEEENPLIVALNTILQATPEDFTHTARLIMESEPSLVSMKQAVLLQTVFDLKTADFPMIPR